VIAARPIALVVLPGSLLWKLVLVLAGSALIALAAQVRIPLPFSPVPVTGQTFAVLLVAAALGRLGLWSVIAYLIEGAMGLPVFAGGTFGVATIVGPTGGYLIGFVLAGALVGRLAELGWDRRIGGALAMMLIGTFVIYAFGLPWLGASMHTTTSETIANGLTPFVAWDAAKLIVAAGIFPVGWWLIGRRPDDR
jgi:biotin transport system substrate-specific component